MKEHSYRNTYPTKYVAIPFDQLDFDRLKEGEEYFVIKDFAVPIKTTSVFNGKQFDSAKISHVLVEPTQ